MSNSKYLQALFIKICIWQSIRFFLQAHFSQICARRHKIPLVKSARTLLRGNTVFEDLRCVGQEKYYWKGMFPFTYQVTRCCFHLPSMIVHIGHPPPNLLRAYLLLESLRWGLFTGRVIQGNEIVSNINF